MAFLAPGLVLIALLQSAGAWVEAPIPEPLRDAEVRAVETAADGSLWFSVRDRGVARWANGTLDWFTENDGLVSNGIADLLADRAGRLWAVGRGGYSVFADGRWTRHRRIGGLQPTVIFTASEDLDGAVWLAANGGAGRWQAGEWSLRPARELPHQVVHAVVVGNDGSVWFATRAGLARTRGDATEIVVAGVNFRSALRDADGRLWFGSVEGVYRWDGQAWQRFLQGHTIYPRVQADDGAIWAGSADAGLYRFNGSEWRRIPLPARFDGAEIFDVAQGRDGSIWAATAAGAVRLVNRRE